MSDFIEQLIASTIDPAAAFRPRPMSLFEASVSAALSVTGSEEPASVSVSFPAPHSVAAVPHMETPEIVPEHEHPPLTAPMSTEPVVREAVNPRVPDLPAPPPSALTTSPHPTVPADYFAEPAALPAIQPTTRLARVSCTVRLACSTDRLGASVRHRLGARTGGHCEALLAAMAHDR
jgi:hypothetical protein